MTIHPRRFRQFQQCIAKIVLASLVLFSQSAKADNMIYTVPTGWRLQNFVGSHVVAYYAGTSCFGGQVLMPSTSTDEEEDRFIAMVTTAKVTGRNMGVYYETSSGNCYITSFFLQD